MASMALHGAKGFAAADASPGLRFVEHAQLRAARASSDRRGCSLIAFSGQVVSHRPHCTQFFSSEAQLGVCGLSCRALAGQALTQLRHRVQLRLYRP